MGSVQNFAHISHATALFEMFRISLSGSIFMYRRMLHWLAALPIRKRSPDPGAADFLHDAFQGIVGPDLDPMAVGEGVVGEGLAALIKFLPTSDPCPLPSDS